MTDEKDTFRGLNKAGKSRELTSKPAITATMKQLFFRLQEQGAMALTPPEKQALLDVYQIAFPEFYTREMPGDHSSWFTRAKVTSRMVLRAIGWIVTGILVVFIIALLARMI